MLSCPVYKVASNALVRQQEKAEQRRSITHHFAKLSPQEAQDTKCLSQCREQLDKFREEKSHQVTNVNSGSNC